MAWGCSESGFLDMGRSGRKACPLCGWLVQPGFAVGVVEQGMGGWVCGCRVLEYIIASVWLPREILGVDNSFGAYAYSTRASRYDTGGDAVS